MVGVESKMVWKIECDCNERVGIKIESIKLFGELKEFFDTQVERGIFKDEEVTETFYIWKGDGEEKKMVCYKVV